MGAQKTIPSHGRCMAARQNSTSTFLMPQETPAARTAAMAARPTWPWHETPVFYWV